MKKKELARNPTMADGPSSELHCCDMNDIHQMWGDKEITKKKIECSSFLAESPEIIVASLSTASAGQLIDVHNWPVWASRQRAL